MESKFSNENLALDSFVKLVGEMREAQTLYFKTKTGLERARKIEAAVDRFIREHKERKQGQGRLFQN